MKRHTAILTIASAVICVTSLILLPVSRFWDLPDYPAQGNVINPRASISMAGYHCAIARGGVWFFNCDLAYTGSITNLEGEWGGIPATERPDWSWRALRYGISQDSYIDNSGQSVGKRRAGDLPGVYYRHFETRSQSVADWTLAVSLWYLVAISAPLPGWWLIRRAKVPAQFSLHVLFVGLTILAVALGIFIWVSS